MKNLRFLALSVCFFINNSRNFFEANLLESVGDALNGMMSLEELYLSENFIKEIDGVSSLTNLIILDYSYNQISKLNGIENLQKLEEFWVIFSKYLLIYYHKGKQE